MPLAVGDALADSLESNLRLLNDIDDGIANSASECNYEDYEEFKGAGEISVLDQDQNKVLKELKKLSEALLVAGEKCDVRQVFEESSLATLKFNLYIWYFLEAGKKSEASEEDVENGVYAACTYISMCSLHGSNTELFQIGLYTKCLKIVRNCCQTVRLGETIQSKKGSKKSKMIGNSENPEDDEKQPEPSIGPPKISSDSAERYLNHLTTQFFGFLRSNVFSIDAPTLMATFEMIEEIGRLDLDTRTVSRAFRANSVQEFRGLERFTDRYSSFLHILVESKYQTRGELTYARLIRPRLALMPYPDESDKTSKISTERKRAGELTVNWILSRISRNPGQKELKLVEIIVVMVYSQCPDLAEFRTNISQFIQKILDALPYRYVYDFVQLMHIMVKGRGGGVKSLSTDLACCLIHNYDFSAPDPGPVEEDVENSDENPENDAENSESEAEEEDVDGDDDEDDVEKSEKEKNKKDKKKKRKSVEDVDRQDAFSILYNIIYMACIDKTAAMRLHGANSLSKILESEKHRVEFQETCQKTNSRLDEKFGDADDHLNETLEEMNLSDRLAAATGSKKAKPTDLLLDEQQIIQKFNKLKMMNKGETRVEKDIVYMIIRRLATDDKAPVKKSSCSLIRTFLTYCTDEIKFEVMIGQLQRMCRDKMVTVRKTAAEAITELMFQENVVFKENLSSKWLHSLIGMLNDTDNDVTEHARKLIMKVLTPLLEAPSDITWTLLDTIESVTNHRQYLMSTLKDAVREKLVKRSTMDTMKNHISSGDPRQRGAWMVFSQLCCQFEQNVDFVIDELMKVDLGKESDLVQYMVHVIENNVKKIDGETKETLEKTLRNKLMDYCIHSAHARSVYHCVAKLMDGIGDRATNGPAFRDFADEILVKCFDTIVQSFEMHKDKDHWSQNAASQERVLCTALNIVSEVFSFSPQLIPRHERLGKTLSLIVNSTEKQSDSTTVNPDMPSAHVTRPSTQMSEIPPNSQKSHGGLMSHEGILFSDKVRAAAVVTLANMILAHDRLLKLMPMLVKQLQHNPSHQIRSNIVVAIGDICASYKTDRYAPMLAASLCDPSVLVRRHAINQIARLISYGIFRFNGEIMIRMMLATLDANEDVRNDAKLYISEVLQSEEPNFFPINFVQYMIALTQAKRLIGTSHDEDDRGQVDVAIGGGDPLARPSRIAIYTFMIESLDDRSRFNVKMSICQRIFTPIVNGEYDFGDYNVKCLLDDALLIMASNEMQVKMDVGKNPNENAMDDPSPEVMEAATGFMQKVYLDHYMKTIVPSILALREFLNQHRSPLQRKCLVAIRMICFEHKNDIDEILQDNRQLKDEMMFELQRVKQRTEEANRILDEYLKRVAEFHKNQKRASIGEPMEIQEESPEEEEGVPMCSTPTKKMPALDALRTPATALRSRTEHQSTPQSRPLSPKTLKKIRRSVGALINNEMRLKQPDLEDTQMDDAPSALPEAATSNKSQNIENIQNSTSTSSLKENGEKTVVEEVMEATNCENPPENVENDEEKEAEPLEKDDDSRRSRRRKTPNYDENESVDADGKIWKKPKIVEKSPKRKSLAADTSMNVTLRRSRRGRPSASDVSKKEEGASRKRKADVVEEPEDSEDVEKTSRSREMTPLMFDENKLSAGRQCSTPIRENDPNDMTFALNLSAITEKEELKNRKSQAHHLQRIFEDDEDEE